MRAGVRWKQLVCTKGDGGPFGECLVMLRGIGGRLYIPISVSSSAPRWGERVMQSQTMFVFGLPVAPTAGLYLGHTPSACSLAPKRLWAQQRGGGVNTLFIPPVGQIAVPYTLRRSWRFMRARRDIYLIPPHFLSEFSHSVFLFLRGGTAPTVGFTRFR